MVVDRRPRIAVLSDDRLFCEGLVRILAEEKSVVVIGYDESGGFEPALRAGRPSIVLLDTRVVAALHLCGEIIGSTGANVIMLAAPDNDQWSSDALDAGARGVLTKDARIDDLVLAMKIVQDGGIWARRRVLAARIDRLSSAATGRGVMEMVVDPRLSAREAEVFRHAATGLGNKEVADRLAITEATVKVHLTHIFQKLGLRGRTELAAAYHGILPMR